MTIFDNQTTTGAREDCVGPRRPRLVVALLERSRVATLSFAHCRPRGPPVAG
jgi:hypothetical protein